MSRIISTKEAPAAVGPYAQAVQAGNVVYCSGQIALVPATGNLVMGDIRAEAKQIFKNIYGILKAVNATRDQVVKTTVYLTDMNDFGALNEVYAEFFGNHTPARSCVAVKELPKGARIEIEATVVLE